MNIQELKNEILKEKERTNTLILAHNYQRSEILEIADICGDSFLLSKVARDASNTRVLMCGVSFMGETVKILSPEKEVILSCADATCPMADQIEVERVIEYKKEHPDHAICAYINTNSDLKAVADVCVTSSSAVKIVNALPQKDILFLPDKNLGAYVASQCPDKNVHLMDGYCPIHNYVLPKHIKEMKVKYPKALVAIHGECPMDTLKLADMVGSTKEIIEYAKENVNDEIIFVTERGVCEYMQMLYPNRSFYQLVPDILTCPNMKKTTLTGVLNALKGTGGKIIELDEDARLNALSSIEKMLNYGG